MNRTLDRLAIATLALGLTSALPHVALAEYDEICAPEERSLFSCSVPEHNAMIQICRSTTGGMLTYTYIADGKSELSFSGGGSSGAADQVRGMDGWSYYTGLSNGGPFFAIFVAEAILLEDQPAASSRVPNPVVLQVYSNVDALEKTPDDFIARRVCDPLSVQIDREWFGPG